MSDANNLLTTSQSVEILKKMYENEDVEIITISDVDSVNSGRSVGCEINEFVPGTVLTEARIYGETMLIRKSTI